MEERQAWRPDPRCRSRQLPPAHECWLDFCGRSSELLFNSDVAGRFVSPEVFRERLFRTTASHCQPSRGPRSDSRGAVHSLSGAFVFRRFHVRLFTRKDSGMRRRCLKKREKMSKLGRPYSVRLPVSGLSRIRVVAVLVFRLANWIGRLSRASNH